MLNLPSPPTDNLYKFLALTGLALLLFSVVYPTSQLNELELKAVDARTQLNVLQLDVAQLEQDVADAGKRKDLPPEDLAVLRQRHSELKLKSVQATGEARRLGVLVKHARYALNALVFGSVLGGLLAHMGFYLWYVRVQKPADSEIRSRALAKDA